MLSSERGSDGERGGPVTAPAEQQPDLRPGHYYVSAYRDTPANGYYLLAGPWPMHAEALAQVDAVRRFAEYVAPTQAHWMAYGTCRTPDDEEARPSKLGAAQVEWQLYALYMRKGGKHCDAGYWRKVSAGPLTHKEALTVRSKHSDPAHVMLYPYNCDPNVDPTVKAGQP